MKNALASAILVLCLAAPANAQVVDLSDLWMACDLAQVDAGGDAPIADTMKEIKLVERPGEPPKLRILASTETGDGLFCEMTFDVITFRHNAETIIEQN